MTKPAKLSKRVAVVEVGEYNDRIPIEIDAQISDDALIFGHPSERAWRCERRRGNLEHPRNEGVHYR